MVAIMFVCLGNICRSPAAEGMLRHLAHQEGIDDLHIESCGIGKWHVGKLPDERMRQSAEARGIVLASRAQQFQPEFLDAYDYFFASDHTVLDDLHYHANHPEQKAKLHLMTAFSQCYSEQEIPDPYYQGNLGFEHVLDMLEDSCRGVLQQLKDIKKRNH